MVKRVSKLSFKKEIVQVFSVKRGYIMDMEKIKNLVTESYNKYKYFQEGKNASYIPFLSQVNSDLCSMSVITMDGELISIGDDKFKFAIESISKVCTLALVMEEIGAKEVRKKLGTSPTGLPFDSIMALELHKDKPLSPLVNAGAIATTSLVNAENKDMRWNKILEMQKKFMDNEIKLSEEVNRSEQNTNFHNRAISWLLYSSNQIYCDPMVACEIYTRQCSTLVSSIELAKMAGTLANKGINPVTKERVIEERNVPYILAEMTMEGMYEGSGDFAYLVGLPGKSGVGGGIIAVVPGKLGIATFSPKLDSRGNSIRGQKMIKHFTDKLGVNIYTL